MQTQFDPLRTAFDLHAVQTFELVVEQVRHWLLQVAQLKLISKVYPELQTQLPEFRNALFLQDVHWLEFGPEQVAHAP